MTLLVNGTHPHCRVGLPFSIKCLGHSGHEIIRHADLAALPDETKLGNVIRDWLEIDEE